MVQIKNRITGLYDTKGECKGWTDNPRRRGAWGSIAQAKSHVTMKLSQTFGISKSDVEQYADSDFIILNDDNTITAESVLSHVVYRLEEAKRKMQWDAGSSRYSEICDLLAKYMIE